MRPFPTRVTRSVVFALGVQLNCAETAEPIKVPLGGDTAGPNEPTVIVLGGGCRSAQAKGHFQPFFVLREGSGAYYTVDSIRLLVYIVCFPTDPFSSLFLTYILPYVSFPLRLDPLRFRAGCRNRRVKPGFSFLCVYFVL